MREGIPEVHSMSEHADVLTAAYDDLIARRQAAVVA